jgi:hypothetical protein
MGGSREGRNDLNPDGLRYKIDRSGITPECTRRCDSLSPGLAYVWIDRLARVKSAIGAST